MFLYLAERGRYWLRTMVMTWAALICLGAVSPAVSMAADPMSDWSQSNTNKEIFKPWIDGKTTGSTTALPWNGNWKAFNSTMSERAGGTCALNSADQKALKTFRDGAQTDWQKIDEFNQQGKADYADSKMTQKFRDALNYRLGNTSSGKIDSGNGLGPKGKTSMRTLFNANTIKNISDLDSFQSLITTAPDFAACTQIHSTFDNLKKNVFPNPIVLFKEPARFIVQLIAFIPTTIATLTYSLISYPAFGLLLSTPHSERGDTIFNSFSYQAANGATGHSKLRALVGSSGQTNSAVSNQKICNTSAKKYTKTDAELGFACQNLNQGNQNSNTWIGIANGLRSTLSAIYGIIVISVALIYLFRRNAQSQYNLKVVMPRLFFAVLLSVTAPYLIGAVISISNFILQSILSVQQGSLPAELHRAVVGLMNMQWGSSAVNFGGIGEAMISIMVPMFVLSFFSMCLCYFIFIAIAKQIALAALIIMTPVACLSFVFRDSGKNILALWAKGIVAISAIPVAVASVLVLGIQVSNVFWNPDTAGGGMTGLVNTNPFGTSASAGAAGMATGFLHSISKLLAVAVLCVAMVMAMKMIGKLRKWVTGSKTGMVGRGMGTAVKIGGLAAAGVATAGGSVAAAGLISSATGAVGNRMREGGPDRKWLPSSSGTFGSASATPPGRDLSASAGRALSQFNKASSMDKLVDKPNRTPSSGSNETPSRGGNGGNMDGGGGNSADLSLSERQQRLQEINEMDDGFGKGLAVMRHKASGVKSNLTGAVGSAGSSAVSHLPGGSMLKNAFAGESAVKAAIAGTAVGGPVLGAALAAKARGRAAQSKAVSAAQDAAQQAAHTSGYGADVDDFDGLPGIATAESLGDYGFDTAAAAAAANQQAATQAAAQAATQAAAQTARDRALNRRKT